MGPWDSFSDFVMNPKQAGSIFAIGSDVPFFEGFFHKCNRNSHTN